MKNIVATINFELLSEHVMYVGKGVTVNLVGISKWCFMLAVSEQLASEGLPNLVPRVLGWSC